MKDLLVLCADKNMQACLAGVLPRFSRVYGLADFSMAEPIVHPANDPGCRTAAHVFLKGFSASFRFCLVVLDFEGSGTKLADRATLELEIEQKLAENGWADRSAAIVIQPELENWIWVKSPHLAAAAGWPDLESLEKWLVENGWKTDDAPKPARPKEAFEMAIRLKKLPRSSSIYAQIAQKASFLGCTDPAFLKMVDCLKGWFPASI